VAGRLVLQHSWRPPGVTERPLTEAEDRLVRACVRDLLAFTSFQPHDENLTALLFLDPEEVDAVVGAWTVAGALRLAEMLRERAPDLSRDISTSF
jgi:hypothetical protein